MVSAHLGERFSHHEIIGRQHSSSVSLNVGVEDLGVGRMYVGVYNARLRSIFDLIEMQDIAQTQPLNRPPFIILKLSLCLLEKTTYLSWVIFFYMTHLHSY